MIYKKGSALVVLLVIVLIIVAVVFFVRRDGSVTTVGENITNKISDVVVGNPVTHTVTYTDDGYTPKEITIKTSDTIIFRNASSRAVWTATAIHPTHTVYPGSDIANCGSSDAGSMFDTCRGLENGEEWSFTFSESGTWGYHNHLRPSDNGKVVVE